MTNFSKLKNFNIILLVILSSIIIFIYFPLFQESVYFKQLDFQWSPSKLVSQGINHYDYMLNGNREGLLDLSMVSIMVFMFYFIHLQFYLGKCKNNLVYI